MTTNQTIDGVPRELLAKALLDAQRVRFATDKQVIELRALLDAPACKVCNDTKQMHEPGQEPGSCAACFEDEVAQGLGEPVAPFGYWLSPKDQPSLGRFHRVTPEDAIIDSDSVVSYFDITALYAEQPESVAVVLPERSNQDYAIEHAEYMAKSADGVLAKFQAYGLALLAVDERGDDGEGELFEAIDTARGDLQESLVDLRSMVYEFRKRSAKP